MGKPYATRCAFVLSAALCFLLPFSTASTNILTAAVTLCWLIGGTVRQDIKVLSREPFAWCLLAFLIWAVVSWLWTTDTTMMYLDSIGKYRKLLFIFPFVAIFSHHPEWKMPLLRSLGLGIFVLVLACFGKWFSGLDANGAVLFKNHITQGYLFAVLLTLLIGEYALHPSPRRRFTVIGIAVLTMFATFHLSIGRTGYVCTAVVIVLASVFFLRSLKRYCLVLAVLGTLFGVSLVTSPYLHQRIDDIQNDFSQYRQHNVATSQGQRIEFWLTSLQMFKEHPVLGTGCGSWVQHWKRLQIAKGETNHEIINFHNASGNPHQDYLNQLSQLGIVGFFFWLAFLVFVAGNAWHTPTEDRWLFVGIVGSYLVACLFNSMTRDVTEGHVFVIIVSLLMAKHMAIDTRLSYLQHCDSSSLPSKA